MAAAPLRGHQPNPSRLNTTSGPFPCARRAVLLPRSATPEFLRASPAPARLPAGTWHMMPQRPIDSVHIRCYRYHDRVIML